MQKISRGMAIRKNETAIGGCRGAGCICLSKGASALQAVSSPMQVLADEQTDLTLRGEFLGAIKGNRLQAFYPSLF